MTANNNVIVQAQWDDGSVAGGFASGNFEFIASGSLVTTGNVEIVTPFIDGQLDSLGSLSLPAGKFGSVGVGAANSGIALLASDNFAVGLLTWNIKIIVQGVANIQQADVPINFASGATQGLFTILTAAGWNPTGF